MAAQNGNRAAPADEHAEAGLLGAALHRPEVAAVVASLDPYDFYNTSHQYIAAAIADLHNAGEKVDPVLVLSRLTSKQQIQVGGLGDLLSLQVAAPIMDEARAESYAARIRETKHRRQVITLLADATDAAYEGDPAPILAQLADVAVDTPQGDLVRAPLGDLIRTGVPEPTMVHPWLYAGGLHAIQSEPSGGKTMVALWLTGQMMSNGWAVVYLDEEGGEELVAERLAALGIDPALVDRLLFYYPFPERRWTDADLRALRSTLEQAGKEGPVGMGVLDSLPDFLASASMNEDSSMDVTTFVRRILTPFREVGAALVVLDHMAKPDAAATGRREPKKKGRYGRGSGAKLAKTHATFLLETAEPFDREHSGRLHLWQTKDRRGFTGLPHHGAKPLVLDVQVSAGAVRFEIGEPAPDGDLEDWSGPTRCMEDIVAAFTPGMWLSANQVEAIMSYKRDTVRQALRKLTEAGQLVRRPGPRRAMEYAVPGEELPVQEQF